MAGRFQGVWGVGLAQLDCPQCRCVGRVVEREQHGWVWTRDATSEKLGNTSLGRGVGVGTVVVIVFEELVWIDARDSLARFVGEATITSDAVVCLLKGIARGCALGRRGSAELVPFKFAIERTVPLALPRGTELS